MDRHEAFDQLRRAARNTRRQLRQVALEVEDHERGVGQRAGSTTGRSF